VGLRIPEAVGDEDRRGYKVEAPLPPGDGDPMVGGGERWSGDSRLPPDITVGITYRMVRQEG